MVAEALSAQQVFLSGKQFRFRGIALRNVSHSQSAQVRDRGQSFRCGGGSSDIGGAELGGYSIHGNSHSPSCSNDVQMGCGRPRGPPFLTIKNNFAVLESAGPFRATCVLDLQITHTHTYIYIYIYIYMYRHTYVHIYKCRAATCSTFGNV